MHAQGPVIKKYQLITTFLGIFAISSVLNADARTDYLVKMLEKSDNYRLRVQAATTLGKLRVKEAIPSLVKATRDENELVIISAAIALKQIGDPSVLSELEASARSTRSKAARSQLDLTIRILKEIRGNGRRGPSATNVPRFLVRVDAMGNSSSERDSTLPETMRKMVMERIAEEDDIVLQTGKMSGAAVKKRLKDQKLKGYIISGAILKLENQDGRLSVKLGLNLFSNPDYSLLMMPTSEASIGVDTRLQGAKKVEEMKRAIKLVTDSLIDTIFETLRQSGMD